MIATKLRFRTSLSGLLGLIALLPLTAAAHHSHATIDQGDVRIYKGVVVKYGWTMPHVYLKVDAPNEAGEIVEYSIELQHPPAMKGMGWDRDTFKPGDRIIWEGSPRQGQVPGVYEPALGRTCGWNAHWCGKGR